MANNPYISGGTKAPGETAGAPVKPAPGVGGTNRMNTGRPAPTAGLQPQTPGPSAPQLDEFGRDTSAIANSRNPFGPVGDFNQRKANAAMMMPQAAPTTGMPPGPGPMSAPGGLPGTGGGFMYPGPPQQSDPPQFGTDRMQQTGQPYDPQGGLGSGAGQGMFPNTNRQLPGQDQAGGPMQPPPGFQQLMQNPSFMQWLMRMFQGQQQQGGQQASQAPPLPGQPPAQQAGPMTQGPPR